MVIPLPPAGRAVTPCQIRIVRPLTLQRSVSRESSCTSDAPRAGGSGPYWTVVHTCARKMRARSFAKCNREGSPWQVLGSSPSLCVAVSFRGTFTLIEVPLGTQPFANAINASGAIPGSYVDPEQTTGVESALRGAPMRVTTRAWRRREGRSRRRRSLVSPARFEGSAWTSLAPTRARAPGGPDSSGTPPRRTCQTA
jgi:hypothetical protein